MVSSDMELHLLHLYPNLLNVYGDVGNIKIFADRASRRGIDVHIHSVNTEDSIDLASMDIVMLGDGQAEELRLVFAHLSEHKDLFQEYILNDGVFLAIGAGFQIFGNQAIVLNGETIEGLSLLPIYTEKTDKKFVGDIAVSFEAETVVGFENHIGKTTVQESDAFAKVLKGYGNNGEDGLEGFKFKNFFGTNLHGPLLSKNPYLADTLLQIALENKYGSDISFQPLEDVYESEAKKIICDRLNI